MDKRAAIRFPTDLEADCRSCNRAWTSRLCNISATGCMVVCPEEGLPDGALMRLRLKGLTAIDGEIVWQHRGHAGIRFRAELHPTMMAHLGFILPEGTHQPALAVSRPETAPVPRRVATGLHAQLVKRTSQDVPAERLASAG